MHETARFVSGSAQILFFVLDITTNEHVCFFYQTEKNIENFLFEVETLLMITDIKI